MNRRDYPWNACAVLATLALTVAATAQERPPASEEGVEGAAVVEGKPELRSNATPASQQGQQPRIQIALLLDTSSSMSGLISQAKTQLWKIVNEFIPARRGGQRPQLQVALYEYGNSGLEQSDGYIRQIVPLTDDLDKVSEELFALTTNGGQEYCGQVIQIATERLAWSPSTDDLKLIFIAGNEPFTQGEVDYGQACKGAISKGIIVNTIFCGPHATGERTKWKDGALLAEGEYLSIDHNRAVAHVAAPQDAEIARLGVELNETYVPYGAQGEAGQARQQAQDGSVAATGAGNAVQRAITKGSANYLNTSWDLVDAVEQGTVKLEELKDEDLPEALRSMSLEERRAYVAENKKRRGELQQQIQTLNEQRKQFVAAKMKEHAESEEDTLDSAVIRTCRKQATAKRFEFE
jgi:hypothetical protein